MANVSNHWRAAAAIARPRAPSSGRGLPALDYDEHSSRTRVAPPPDSLVDLSRGGRRRAGRAAWFVSGLLLGAIAVASVHGDLDRPLHAIRAWTAIALRSLKTEASSNTSTSPTTPP